jgi:predicted PurR-regulated permease PerM
MHKDTSPRSGEEKQKFKLTRRWVIFGCIYLLFMLLVVCVVNSRHLKDFFQMILSAFRPVTIGLLIAYITNPLYNYLHDSIFTWEKKAQALRKIVSMLFTYAVIILFIIVFVMLLLPQLSSSIQDLSQNLSNYINETLDYVNEVIEGMHLPFEIPTLDIEYILSFLPGEKEMTGIEKLRALLDNLASVASTYVADVIDLVVDIVVGLFIAGYTLASKQRLAAQTRRLLTALFRERGCRSILEFVNDTDQTFGHYVVGKLTDSALVIVVASIAFSLANIPYAILVGFIIGATNIIPFFGPIFGAIPCGLLVFIAEPRKIVTFIILVLVIQQIDANIIDPFITGNATGLSSLGVILSVTIMGNLFGVIGMMLGVPITVSILNLCNKFLDRKLASDFMPTELESYYPPATEQVDMGSGEHVPFFTKLLHYFQARHALTQARKEAKRAGHDQNARRSMTENDVGSDDRDNDNKDNE